MSKEFIAQYVGVPVIPEKVAVGYNGDVRIVVAKPCPFIVYITITITIIHARCVVPEIVATIMIPYAAQHVDLHAAADFKLELVTYSHRCMDL